MQQGVCRGLSAASERRDGALDEPERSRHAERIGRKTRRARADSGRSRRIERTQQPSPAEEDRGDRRDERDLPGLDAEVEEQEPDGELVAWQTDLRERTRET